jgi:hypothetical protein
VAKVTLQLARSAKERAAELLGNLPGLIGIGLTKSARGGYALKVNLESEPTPARRSKLPKAIDGVPIAFEVVGRIKAR